MQLEHVVLKAVATINDAVLAQAEQQDLHDGSTAVFALTSETQILLGHLGDSKAIVCHASVPAESAPAQQRWQRSDAHAGPPRKYNMQAAALTRNHSPARPDELARITASGGFVSRATTGDTCSTFVIDQFLQLTMQS